MKKSTKVIALVLAIVAVMGTVFAACAKDKPAAGGDLEYVKNNGKLVIGYTEYEPMNYTDKETKKFVGFDTEFAEAFCKELGVEAEFVEINWDNKFNELNSKAIDCVWNGMTIEDNFKDIASISTPYAENAQVVVMKNANVDKFADADSIKDLTIAVEGGSAGEKITTANKYANVIVCDTQAKALTEVTTGSADACIIDKTMAKAMTGEGTSNSTVSFKIELEPEQYGVAFRKDSDITEKFNKFLADSIADGSLDKLAEKYGIIIAK